MVAEAAILTVGFRNPLDLTHCLAALSNAAPRPEFDVFICENGGRDAFHKAVEALLGQNGPCERAEAPPEFPFGGSDQFIQLSHLRLRTRSSNVWIGCAAENLGYAGGINAWLRKLQGIPGWRGIWVLNPDTRPDVSALAALVERAETAGKGMVGSTILDVGPRDAIRCRGGLRWQRLGARSIALGRGEPAAASADTSAVEAAMDSPSGASMYVTRSCIEKIGIMDEAYFLFFEDLDWGMRAQSCGLGYARSSIVTHKRGTTTGSGKTLRKIPQISIYLEHRNAIHFVRKFFPYTLPIRVIVSILQAIRFLLVGAPKNCSATVAGILAGLRKEIGPPSRYQEFFGRFEQAPGK